MKGKDRADDKMVIEKDWNDFRKTGLLLIINQILHIFGWAIVVDYKSYDKNNDTGMINKVYPARVKYRGFEDKSVDKAYKKVTKYMNKNSKELLDEVKD